MQCMFISGGLLWIFCLSRYYSISRELCVVFTLCLVLSRLHTGCVSLNSDFYMLPILDGTKAWNMKHHPPAGLIKIFPMGWKFKRHRTLICPATWAPVQPNWRVIRGHTHNLYAPGTDISTDVVLPRLLSLQMHPGSRLTSLLSPF